MQESDEDKAIMRGIDSYSAMLLYKRSAATKQSTEWRRSTCRPSISHIPAFASLP
jgi:hypothetical protein